MQLTLPQILVAILGLALLMVVHEGGHHLAARAFGMRVIRFSIGFGPPLWKHQPKGSDTVYQLALIPFLAYVQIAGMNPLEEIDPDDKGSYANASLIGRITTIFAGPFANYLFASVLFFAALMIGGVDKLETTIAEVAAESTASATKKAEAKAKTDAALKADGVKTAEPTKEDKKAAAEKKKLADANLPPEQHSAARRAGLKKGDVILTIDGKSVHNDWEALRSAILAAPGKSVDFEIQRDGKTLHLPVIPEDVNGKGLIGIVPSVVNVPIGAGPAAIRSMKLPALQVANMVVMFSRLLTGQEEAKLSGPIEITKVIAKAASLGSHRYFQLLGFISISLAFFNMLPVPALDGGRLMFLGYEVVSRRRPNARIEAVIHGVGVIILLGVLVVVSFKEILS